MIRLRSLVVVLALAAALPFRASAACASKEECLAAIERTQRDTRTLQADFEQVKHLELLAEPLVSRGRFLFKRPDRVRLEVKEPRPATLVIRGNEVYIPGVSQEDQRALATAPAAAMFSRLGALFTGSTRELEEDFSLSARPDGEAIEVALEPKQERWRKVLHRMELRFAGPELLIAEIRIDDSFGDRLAITMRDVRRNVDLPDSLFDAPG